MNGERESGSLQGDKSSVKGAGYSGRPLPAKLGIKPYAVVALVDAPEDFRVTLGALPEGAALHEGAGAPCDLTLWFTRMRADLDAAAPLLWAQSAYGPVWIAWPKKASGFGSDLTETDVRDVGLAAGLVDYKVCAIDATWSGLLFTRRKAR